MTAQVLKARPVVGYVRVSTQDQAQDGISLADQRNRIARYCEAVGMPLACIHSDEGISGAKANRAGLKSALDEVRKSKGILLVVSISRLSRSTRDLLSMVETLEKGGCAFVSLSEQIDTGSPAGRLMLTLLAGMAAFEREQLVERTKSAMSHLRGQNKRISRHIPFGWRQVEGDSSALEKDEAEQAILARMLVMRDSQDKKLREIAEQLNAEGIKAKQGGRWTESVVWRILKRRHDLAMD